MPHPGREASVQQQKLAESRLDLANSQELLEEYKLILENSRDAILLSVGPEFVYVNAAYLKFCGLQDKSQLAGLPLDHFVAPEDRERVNKRSAALGRGEPIAGTSEFRLRTIDGMIRTVESSSVAVSYKGQRAALVWCATSANASAWWTPSPAKPRS